MDSITKGQRNLLLFILGIAILVLPIRFFAMDNFDKKKTIDSETNERQNYYNDLLAKKTDRSILMIQQSTRVITRQLLLSFLQSCIRTTQSCTYRM